jgi:hypothetical protein
MSFKFVSIFQARMKAGIFQATRMYSSSERVQIQVLLRLSRHLLDNLPCENESCDLLGETNGFIERASLNFLPRFNFRGYHFYISNFCQLYVNWECV